MLPVPTASRFSPLTRTTAEERVAREEALVLQEHKSVLVKVVQASYDDEATIFGEARSKLKYQKLSAQEKEWLGDDESAFFVARWNTGEVKWDLIRRAPANARW
jgi:hypothetical protein